MKSILFVCIENSQRSQMAEAFARRHGQGLVEAQSAGSSPAAAVHPRAIEAMAEVGYDLTDHKPKSLAEVGPGPWDYVVLMGCGDVCPFVPTRRRIEWQLRDPKDLPDSEYRQVRDEIERRVVALLAAIGGDTERPAD